LALLCAGVIYAADTTIAVVGVIRDADRAAQAAPPVTTPHIWTPEPDASPVGAGVLTRPSPAVTPFVYTDEVSARFTLTAEDTQTAIDLYNARIIADNASVGDGLARPGVPQGAEYLGALQVYGYNFTDPAQCSASGITASGDAPVSGETCAYNAVPFGTRLYIEGFGVVTVNDRTPSGAEFVDVAFDNNEECYAITGVRGVWRLSDD
jgi:3D (Asp-Asp-Asp) domain-containing protein